MKQSYLNLVDEHHNLDLQSLQRVTEKPPLWAPHEALFWDDPHISAQMLAAHLDPNTDAASRKPETIDRTVEWLVYHLHLEKGQRVLDLGCGPGLYCVRLHEHGLSVTGLDYSRRSIRFARQYAVEHGLAIDWVWKDYLTLDYAEEFDAAVMVYYDFGVLSDVDRDELLVRLHRALKPGGAFVFDVMTRPQRPAGKEERRWGVRQSGFWKPGPYLELTERFWYPEADAELEQTVIIEESGEISLYRLWNRFYSPETIARVIGTCGFQIEDIRADLTGKPYAAGSPSLGVVARRV